jgi:hypothetical protein
VEREGTYFANFSGRIRFIRLFAPHLHLPDTARQGLCGASAGVRVERNLDFEKAMHVNVSLLYKSQAPCYTFGSWN